MLKNKSLKTKLALGFSLILIGLIVMGTVGLFQLNKLNNIVHDIKDQNFDPTIAFGDLQTNLVTLNKLILTQSILEDKEEAAANEKHILNKIKLVDESFEDLTSDPKHSEFSRNIAKESLSIYSKIKAQFPTYFELTRKNLKSASQFYVQNLEIPFTQSIEKMAEATGDNISLFDETIIDANSLYKIARNLILGFIIGLLVIGTWLSISISNSVSKPIETVARKLVEKSEHIKSASEHLTDASHALASSSNEQASAVEQTSASMEEIGGMVENNTQSSERSVQNAKQVSEQLVELNQSMQDVLKANDEIKKLVQIIGQIGEKTKIIDEIVFQTKLLSFNASIEAERAGEHGRGFSVVAQEVGNLAKMSGQSAIEISKIVSESLKSAEEIVSENDKRVKKGSQLSDLAKAKADHVAKEAQSILTASKEQAEGIKQINNAILQISKTTQQNAQFAQETSSSSTSLTVQAQELDHIILELRSVVDGQVGGPTDNNLDT